jgi:tetratricopeptide (TPR) repeat protein
LTLIEYLLDSLRTSPIYICAISRPFEGGSLGSLQDFARKRLVNRMTVLPVTALSQDKSRELLESLLRIPALPEDLRLQIVQRAGGIPLYLEEILRKLIEDGIIYLEDGYWKLSSGIDTGAIGVPDTLQNLILDRFDRLEPLHRKVLQTASVIGQQFNLPILREVLKTVRPRDLEASLAFLAKREFILPLPGIFEATYLFKHVLVSDAIYGTLLRRDSRELHGKVGRAIEMIYVDHLDNQVELLANHYLKSAVFDRALHFTVLTAQKAARGYTNEQARQYFEQALALFTRVEASIDQILQVHIGLGDVLVIIGEYQAARDHYQHALENIPNRGTEQSWLDQSILQRKIAASFERQGDFDKALARLYTSQQFLSQMTRPPDLEKACILNDIGWIHFRRGNLEEAERYLQDALVLVVRSQQKDVIASIYNRLGGVYFRKEELERASQYTRQSLTLREEIGDVLGVARSYNNLGLLAYASGKWDEALLNYKKDLELQSRLGDAEALAISYHNIGELQIDLGDSPEAQANLELSLEAAQQSGATFHIAAAHASLGRLRITLGDFEKAVNHLQESRRIFAEMGVNELLVDVYHLLGEAFLGLKNIPDAQKWANRSIDLVAVLGSRSLSKTEQHGRATRLLGKISLQQGDFESANRHLRTSLNVFKIKDSQLEQGRTLVELGRLDKMRNQPQQSRTYLLSARSIFQKLGAKNDLNQIQSLLDDMAG